MKARPVLPGATIGIIAPAGRLTAEALDRGLSRLHAWGYKTVVGEAVLDQNGHLAGQDSAKLADFHRMWADPSIDAILCARGGYGSYRLLPDIDWDLIRANPKFFCGFSDITALHAGIERCTGLVTFHGPMATAFGEAEAYNGAGLLAAMQSSAPLGQISWPEPGPDVSVPVVVQPGVAEGRLAGGNLSLLVALMGTPWEPDFTGRIVLIEDVDESPARMERMLTQLLLSGKLQRSAGILFGESPTCLYGPEGRPMLTLMEILEERLRPLGIPVLYGFPCGHEQWRATLPLGVAARLDSEAGSLTVLEAALA